MKGAVHKVFKMLSGGSGKKKNGSSQDHALNDSQSTQSWSHVPADEDSMSRASIDSFRSFDGRAALYTDHMAMGSGKPRAGTTMSSRITATEPRGVSTPLSTSDPVVSSSFASARIRNQVADVPPLPIHKAQTSPSVFAGAVSPRLTSGRILPSPRPSETDSKKPASMFPAVRGAVSPTFGVARDDITPRGSLTKLPTNALLVVDTAPVTESKDTLRPLTNGPVLSLQLERIQSALIQFAEDHGVYCIVDKPSRILLWNVSMVKTKAFLQDHRTFDIESCVVVGDSPSPPKGQVNYMNPKILPLAPLLVTALLKGENKKVVTLGRMINGLKQVQSMAKSLVLGEQAEGQWNETVEQVANGIVAAPMWEAADVAGFKYDQMIFASSSVKKAAMGMCPLRESMLLAWVRHIEGAVRKNYDKLTESMLTAHYARVSLEAGGESSSLDTNEGDMEQCHAYEGVDE